MQDPYSHSPAVKSRSWALRAAMMFSRLGPAQKMEYRGRYQQSLAMNLAQGHALAEAERRAYLTVRQLARWAGAV